VTVLVGAAVLIILLADLSFMSKAEVERIWLPFVPWLLLSVALLPPRWRRCGLVAQIALALVLQTLVRTRW
jgi:methylthioxylose transferase